MWYRENSGKWAIRKVIEGRAAPTEIAGLIALIFLVNLAIRLSLRRMQALRS